MVRVSIRQDTNTGVNSRGCPYCISLKKYWGEYINFHCRTVTFTCINIAQIHKTNNVLNHFFIPKKDFINIYQTIAIYKNNNAKDKKP
jgi:hypothetical protein